MLELIFLFGLSIAAGFVGTVFMTISQEIELRFINKRPISFSPALAFFKVFQLDFERLSYNAKVIATYLIHFGYGTLWGFPLALFYFFGYTNPVSVGIAYLVIVLFQGWITLWFLGIAGPPWTWEYKTVVYEIIHKMIYATSTTVSFMLLLD